MSATRYVTEITYDGISLSQDELEYMYISLSYGTKFRLTKDGNMDTIKSYDNLCFKTYYYDDHKYRYFLLTNDERRKLYRILKLENNLKNFKFLCDETLSPKFEKRLNTNTNSLTQIQQSGAVEHGDGHGHGHEHGDGDGQGREHEHGHGNADVDDGIDISSVIMDGMQVGWTVVDKLIVGSTKTLLVSTTQVLNLEDLRFTTDSVKTLYDEELLTYVDPMMRKYAVDKVRETIIKMFPNVDRLWNQELVISPSRVDSIGELIKDNLNDDQKRKWTNLNKMTVTTKVYNLMTKDINGVYYLINSI